MKEMFLVLLGLYCMKAGKEPLAVLCMTVEQVLLICIYMCAN